LFRSIKNLFENLEDSPENKIDDLHLMCGLMVEAANVDGNIDQSEVNKISKVLISIFDENPTAVEIELKKCLDEINEHKSLHYFTSKINKFFNEDKKILLLEMLWEIILEDGLVHDFESNLIRRLAGLLYISDKQSGYIKKKTLENFKKKNN
tara:strand:+ start:60 stop:515 length:456 start_codon:yes stop_codon:yes gene_type:complete